MRSRSARLRTIVLILILIALLSPRPLVAQTGGGQQQGTIPMGPPAQSNDGLVVLPNTPDNLRLGVFIQHHASFIVNGETVNADDIDSDIAAEFIVKNVSNHPVTIKSLIAGGRGPGAAIQGWNAPHLDWPAETDITLQPGEEHPYGESQDFAVFKTTGHYFAEPAYQNADGQWGGIPLEDGSGYARVDFNVIGTPPGPVVPSGPRWPTDCTKVPVTCLPVRVSVVDIGARWQQEVRAAVDIWNSEDTALRFTFADVPDSMRTINPASIDGLHDLAGYPVAPGEIRILPASKVLAYVNTHGGQGDLGQCQCLTIRNTSDMLAGWIIMQDDNRMPQSPTGRQTYWGYDGVPAPGKIDFRSVMAHELGHALGITDHIPGTNPRALMYSYETDWGIFDNGFVQRSLTNADRTALYARYGHRTSSVAPATPNLRAPANQQAGISRNPTFQWDPVQNATQYYLQVSEGPSFGSLAQNTISSEASVLGRFDAKLGVDYYWRVKASNGAMNGDWSPVWTFKAANVGDFPNGRPSYAFPQTGQTVDGRFWQMWQSGRSFDDSLYINGLPLTDAHNEGSPTDGKTYKTQWFERARLEYHPENQPPYDVLLGLLGTAAVKGRENEPPFKPVPNPAVFHALTVRNSPTLGLPWFRETGHTLGDGSEGGQAIAAYWNKLGGLSQFGFPLSQPFMERNQGDGKTYLVQYFERQRFEYHPENKGTQYEVLLGRLGAEQLKGAGAGFGPHDGVLLHTGDRDQYLASAGVNLKDFEASVRFKNPVDAHVHSWDVSMQFRHPNNSSYCEVIIWVAGDGAAWDEECASGPSLHSVRSGPLSNWDSSASGENDLRIVAQEALGSLYVNGQRIADLDLSPAMLAGDVIILTGRVSQDWIPGASTQYIGFTVRPLEAGNAP